MIIIIIIKEKTLLTNFWNKLSYNIWSTTFHASLTGKNLKVLNIIFFKFQTAIYSIFTNYETDNIKERKILSQCYKMLKCFLP